MTGRVIGIIGGSGLYRIDGLTDVEWRRVESPFGSTSDEFCFGKLDGQPVVFLPRHGRGHVLPPTAIPAAGPASATVSPMRPQTGRAIETCATQPGPKKLLSRANVRSMN